MHKFHIVTLGCPKNEADMDILRGVFESNGYKYSQDPSKSDYIIIDTCGFIDSAKTESIDTFFEYLELKKDNRNLKVIAIGCLVQRYFDDFIKDLTELDGLIGVVPPHEVFRVIDSGEYYFKPETPMDVYSCTSRYVPKTAYAYIKIGDGCSRRCSFCSIPNFKGEPMSREIEDICREAEFLVKNGKKELILVSQDNTLYGIDIYKKQALTELLKAINGISGDFIVRVMYLHPDYLTDEIIDCMQSLEKVVNYFDIPMQHGSDRMLKLMGRVKNTAALEKMIAKIRMKPSVVRTSIIVGFPGETDDDFQQLKEFLKRNEFDRLGAFAYSEEEGTPAAQMSGKVDEVQKQERLDELMELQKDISYDIMAKYVGCKLRVLVEEYEDGVYIGRAFMDAPDIDGSIFFKSSRKIVLGSLVEVIIKESYEYDLEGEVI
ncbi:MAG TPA: 30S ribosomal protein S12 methylthiotransferase RimO [Petrotogaceae bacterium]|nr:30S ribosomal protein S12 methylthiotransferase RimO [Petrotogaceae bacterium]HQF32564.1 30S ribosomal protein S12 methylthiotransferase RimO [Petrotogaceae bacterium]HQH33544.1 30S ribosomal protein S12 methylthiotransferase RimO [Petrotogaceae bacterium]HQI77971.1 30S ribosomal protein S12 methylthiotransferase RimO [Petrotogaceae bacterium]